MKLLFSNIETTEFNTILKISALQFGIDFLNIEKIKENISCESTSIIVAKIDTEIIGFSIFKSCNKNQLKSYILDDYNWFEEQFQSQYPVGVIQLTAVLPIHNKRGFGTALINESIARLKTKTNNLLAICWGRKNTSITRIFKNNGFHFLKEIDNYWQKDSLEKGYNCAACGSPPCNCNALIYSY